MTGPSTINRREALRRVALILGGDGTPCAFSPAQGAMVHTYDDDAPMGFSVHEMGTARMGRDPKTSVLNGHNQAHDVPNLFVTDGACMTSSSCVNPSLTCMALTARAVDHAVAELNRRNL